MSLGEASSNLLDLEDWQPSSNRPIRRKMGGDTIQPAGNDQVILTAQPRLPSENTSDPLNWTNHKKIAILLTVSATAFLADYGSSTGAVTSVVQSNALSVLSRHDLSISPTDKSLWTDQGEHGICLKLLSVTHWLEICSC